MNDLPRKYLSPLITLLVLFLPTLLLAAEAVAPSQVPQTQKEKESYSLGYQVGSSMKSGSVDVNLESLLQGLNDGLDGKEPRLKADEMRRLITDLRERTRELALHRIQEQTLRNAEESEKFLKENSKKAGVRSTESGLQYKVLQDGTGTSPKPEDTVRVNYRGTFIDGKEFDSSYGKGESQTVQVDNVIKGWTEALQLMKVGSKLQIFVPPSLAYGNIGLPPTIPPNKALVYEIELLSIEKKGDTKSSR